MNDIYGSQHIKNARKIILLTSINQNVNETQHQRYNDALENLRKIT